MTHRITEKELREEEYHTLCCRRSFLSSSFSVVDKGLYMIVKNKIVCFEVVESRRGLDDKIIESTSSIRKAVEAYNAIPIKL